MSASHNSDRLARPLNETARVIRRPSTSGNATFMAMSRALSPRVPWRQAASSVPANITWRTGQSRWGPGGSNGAPGTDLAKPVAFSTTSGGAALRIPSTMAAATGSLRLVRKIGSGLMARSRRLSIRASMGARFAA